MFKIFKSLLPALLPQRSKSIEDAKKALSRRDINRAEQLQYLQDNQLELFNAFETLCTVSPIKAVQKLLEIETILHTKSRPFFWRTIQKPIGKLLKDTPDEAKKAIYLHILRSAPRGTITDLILDHAEDFGIILSSRQSANDGNLVDLFLSHSAPRTAEFLEKVRPQFLETYKNNPGQRLGFLRTIMKICLPPKEKRKEIPLPDYIEPMRQEQIRALIAQIFDLHRNGDIENKKTKNALQELETLRACESPLFGKVSSRRDEKCDSFFYLFKFYAPIPDATEKITPQLYILAKKAKGRGIPDEGGKLTIVVVTPDIEMIAKAFSATNNDRAAQNVIENLVKHFAPTPSKPKPKLVDLQIRYDAPYAALTMDIPAISYSFELTAKAKGVDSTHEQFPYPLNRGHVPVQQHQPTAL